MNFPGFTAELSLYKTSEQYHLESAIHRYREGSSKGVIPAGDDDCCYWTWSLLFWGICCANARITGRRDRCCP